LRCSYTIALYYYYPITLYHCYLIVSIPDHVSAKANRLLRSLAQGWTDCSGMTAITLKLLQSLGSKYLDVTKGD
jgi:hypothetical protein